ncbi:MAG: hypothetical protein OXR66_08900 [Candidatus Woesearchaeota archaeon]|nr:hypothetical protein [Candidatus Woesearchaeota archaeon]
MSLEAIPREKILEVIQRLGPVQPLDVKRALGTGDLMLIGAILAEMTANNILFTSHTKRGGSPFYYTTQDSLENIAQYLGEKDKRTYDLLKERGVLKEDELEPLTRVSLKNIPDFSRWFEHEGAGHWHYFLLSEEEVMELLQGSPETVEEVAEPVQETLVEEETPAKVTAPKEKPTLHGDLEEQVAGFIKHHSGKMKELNVMKENAQLTCKMEQEGTYGKKTTLIYAVNRKTLPEKLVWTILLEAKGSGLPLLVLNTHDFPKTLAKKFSSIPNVWFEKL